MTHLKVNLFYSIKTFSQKFSFSGHPGHGNFYFDQFREEDSHGKYINEYNFTKSFSLSAGFRGGYPDFINNGPNFFNNQFPFSPAFHDYGSNYGYSNPFNPFF